jgi:hypothetical protein
MSPTGLSLLHISGRHSRRLEEWGHGGKAEGGDFIAAALGVYYTPRAQRLICLFQKEHYIFPLAGIAVISYEDQGPSTPHCECCWPT